MTINWRKCGDGEEAKVERKGRIGIATVMPDDEGRVLWSMAFDLAGTHESRSGGHVCITTDTLADDKAASLHAAKRQAEAALRTAALEVAP